MHVGTVLLNAVVDHLVAVIIIVHPIIPAIHVTTILDTRLQFGITCRANARLEHSQREACMPQLRGVDRDHSASLVLVARFVERPALGIRLVTNEPADGENDIAVVAEHAAKLGLEFAALSGLRDDRAAFARVDEDAESELVGVVSARLCDDMLTNLCTAGNLLAFRLGASSRDRARRWSGLGDIKLGPQPAVLRGGCTLVHSKTYRAMHRLATVQATVDLAVQARAAPAREAAVADNALTHGQELPGLAASGERMVLVPVLVCGTLEVVRCAPYALEPSDLKAHVLFGPFLTAERAVDVVVAAPGSLDVNRLAITLAVCDVLAQPALNYAPKAVPAQASTQLL